MDPSYRHTGAPRHRKTAAAARDACAEARLRRKQGAASVTRARAGFNLDAMTIRCTDGDYPSEVATSVATTVEHVRACFEGSSLSRADAIARLSPVQVEKLFPASLVHARNLRRIGKRIRADKVRSVLHDQPFNVLAAAAAHEDPEEQLQAAMRARAGFRKGAKRDAAA